MIIIACDINKHRIIFRHKTLYSWDFISCKMWNIGVIPVTTAGNNRIGNGHIAAVEIDVMSPIAGTVTPEDRVTEYTGGILVPENTAFASSSLVVGKC